MKRSTEEFLAGTVPATHTPQCGGWRRSPCKIRTELDVVMPGARSQHTLGDGRTRLRPSRPSSWWPQAWRYWWGAPLPERSPTGPRMTGRTRLRRHGGTTGSITRHTNRPRVRALRRRLHRAAPPVTRHHPHRRRRHRRLRRRPRLRPRRRPPHRSHRPLRRRRRSTRRARHTTPRTPATQATGSPPRI